jgi:Holliday junction resolvase RusA-like endonuclease
LAPTYWGRQGGISVEYKFTILGTLPSFNEYCNWGRANKYKQAEEKKILEARLGLTIERQLAGVKIKPPVTIEYTWVEPNKARDIDNICYARKFIQDALVRAVVLADDNQRYIIGHTDIFKVDKEYPRIEVTIKTLNQ